MTSYQIAFLRSKSFAVAGASNNREKYGNIVFRALLEYTPVGRSRCIPHSSCAGKSRRSRGVR